MSVLRKSILLNTGWRCRSGGDLNCTSPGPWYQARPLPTNIHLDLLANGIIPDPYIAKNEQQVQWVGEQTWIYETTFDFPTDVFPRENEKIVLVFEGLDTFAIVKLNGREILTSNNMFVGHRVEITRETLLLNGTHNSQTLQIIFDNAQQMAEEEIAKRPDHKWLTFNSSACRLAARKAQYHYVSTFQIV